MTMGDISEKTRAHLTRVYSTLLTSTLSCVVGMYLNSTFMFTGFLMTLASIFGMIYFMYQVNSSSNSESTQIGYLLAFAFFMGFQAGPGIHHIAAVDPQMLTQAVAYTGTSFASFSAISLFSQRRTFLFLGGVIMTMMQAMALYSIFSWLGGSTIGLGYIMVSLFMTCLWIIFDTQIIVEQAEQGQRQVAKHAMTLFMDLF